MNELGRETAASLEGLSRVLTTWPVLNRLTAYTSLMQPANGTIQSFVELVNETMRAPGDEEQESISSKADDNYYTHIYTIVVLILTLVLLYKWLAPRFRVVPVPDE